MSPFTILSDLPPLTVVSCEACNGEGYFDHDDDPSGCLACGATGEALVCAGCGTVPAVVNGVESCHCAIEWEVAA